MEEEKIELRKLLIRDFENDLKTMPDEMRLFTETECPNCLRLKGSEKNYFFELDDLEKVLKDHVLAKLFNMDDSNFEEVKKYTLAEFENLFDLNLWSYWNVGRNKPPETAEKDLVIDIMNVIRTYWKEKRIPEVSKFVVERFSCYFDTSYYDGSDEWEGMSDYLEVDDYLGLNEKRAEPVPEYDESYFLSVFYFYIKLVDKENNSEIHFLFNIDIDDIYDCSEAYTKLLHYIIK